MKRNLKISSMAAATLVGSMIMTGCSSSDGGGYYIPSAATKAASFSIGASVVDKVSANGLTVSFSDQNCLNNKQLTANNGSFTVALADFNKTATLACTGNLDEDFILSVNPALATIEGGKKLSDEIGLEPLKGTKGKQVNVFSTLAVNTGQPVQDIDVNDPTKPAIKALKSIIQLGMANGASLNTFKDVNLTALSTVTDENLTASVIPATAGIDLTSLHQLSAAFDKNTSITSVSDVNTTGIGTIDAQKAGATAAATISKLSVSSIALTIGSNVWSATENDFNITKTASQTIATSDDIVFTLNAAGLKNFNVSNSTLQAVITNSNGQYLNIVLGGISINNNATSATIDSNHDLIVSSNYSNITTGSTQINTALTTKGLSFSFNALAAHSLNANTTTRAKTEIINALAIPGTYTVTVGLSGIDANATNLQDMHPTLNPGYRGYTGTVIVK